MKKTTILVVGKKSKIAAHFIKGKTARERIISTERDDLDLCSSESIELFTHRHSNTSFDAVIFFASVYRKMPAMNDVHNIQEHLSVHFLGPLAVLQGIRLTTGAKVVFLGDAGLVQPKKDHFGYSFSKSVLRSFIRHLAVEVAPHRRVIGIDLGPVSTEKKGDAKMKFTSKSLIGVDDAALGVVSLIRFIIHEPNFFVSGQMIPFDGGAYIKRSF